MKNAPDGGEALRPLFSAGVREWGLLLLAGVWAAVALLTEADRALDRLARAW